MSNDTNGSGSGTYNQLSDLITFYNRKRKECPKGVSLKLQDNNLYIQFNNPDTGNRTTKSIGVAFTEKGILDAVDKSYQVSEALKRYTTSSDFWEWYEDNIKVKGNTLESDRLTYKQIFEIIKDNYFKGKHRNTGRQRTSDQSTPGGVNDWSSFNRVYGVVFHRFTAWDNYPSWDEIKSVWDTFTVGTKYRLRYLFKLV